MFPIAGQQPASTMRNSLRPSVSRGRVQMSPRVDVFTASRRANVRDGRGVSVVRVNLFAGTHVNFKQTGWHIHAAPTGTTQESIRD
jgi:hypothetical protein